jgi:hypothetical protein
MAVNRDELFADLDKLDVQEIEVKLRAGDYRGQKHDLVELYVERKRRVLAEAAQAEQTDIARIALYISAVAAIGAVAAAVIAYVK